MTTEKKLTLSSFENLMKARRIARAGNPEDRNRLALAGLRVIGRRYAEAGDPDTGKRFAEAADKAEAYLKTADAARAKIEKPVPDFLGDAALTVGKTLVKLLPDAFTDAAGAACWAMGALPMAEARQKVNDAQAARMRLSKTAADALAEFAKIVERTAIEAIGSHDAARCIRELVSIARG